MPRYCDDTVDQKRVNFCVSKYLSGGISAIKTIAKKPGNNLSDALLMSRFQIFEAGAPKNHATRGFRNRTSRSFNSLIISEFISGSNILTIFFEKCPRKIEGSSEPFFRIFREFLEICCVMLRRSHDQICSGETYLILRTFSRNSSSQILFYCVLSSGQ